MVGRLERASVELGAREAPTEPRATPIFVIGSARSGTTWIGNLLASHSRIAAIAAPEHHGIVESHLFDYTQYAMPEIVSVEEFLERYAPEDYFQVAGISDHALRVAARTPADAVSHFTCLMDLCAAREGATHWLEKTPKHAIYVDEIMRRFPYAMFVVIRRGAMATMGSQVSAFGRTSGSRYRRIAEKAFRLGSDLKGVQRLERRAAGRVISVTYEDLLANTDDVLVRVQLFLDIPTEHLVSGFERFESFAGAERQRPVFTRGERFAAAACLRLVQALPFGVLKRVRVAHDRRQASDAPMYTRVRDGLTQA